MCRDIGPGRAILTGMRVTLIALALSVISLPATAWEAGIEDGICVLDHTSPAGAIRVRFDPASALYGIALTRAGSWQAAPVFSIRFDGPASLTISTTRHQIDLQGQRLVVEDTGFGNVLDGLALNDSATAMLGTQEMTVSLQGAAPEVEAFRRCSAGQLA